MNYYQSMAGLWASQALAVACFLAERNFQPAISACIVAHGWRWIYCQTLGRRYSRWLSGVGVDQWLLPSAVTMTTMLWEHGNASNRCSLSDVRQRPANRMTISGCPADDNFRLWYGVSCRSQNWQILWHNVESLCACTYMYECTLTGIRTHVTYKLFLVMMTGLEASFLISHLECEHCCLQYGPVAVV